MSDERKAPAAEYVRRLDAGHLAYQECRDCGHRFHYPRISCPSCSSRAVEFRDSRGLGTVYARTVVHSRNEPPYNVVLVDLDEGFRIMSRVDGVANDAVQIGLRVRLKGIEPGRDGVMPAPVFQPAEAR
ncbi:MAG: hypothetical protein EXQ96_06335 [Alphaproteobacteria bacterium]|nr:hypothetical protein [Alphaproteobacteria bacterium]